MKEYIERAVAIERARNELDLINKSHWSADEIVDFLKRLPAANVVEVWHGEWILSVYTVDIPDTHRWHEWHCSNCGYVRKAGWENTEDGRKPDAKYCEHCMAKMNGGVNDG